MTCEARNRRAGLWLVWLSTAIAIRPLGAYADVAMRSVLIRLCLVTLYVLVAF